MTKRICENCGQRTDQEAAYEWQQQRSRQLGKALDDMTRRAVAAEATLALKEQETFSDQERNQAKILRQSRAIRRLEEKLRKARERGPYAEEADAFPDEEEVPF